MRLLSLLTQFVSTKLDCQEYKDKSVDIKNDTLLAFAEGVYESLDKQWNNTIKISFKCYAWTMDINNSTSCGQNSIIFREKKYFLTDLHFTQPSKHLMTNTTKMEFHLEHKALDSSILIATYLIELGEKTAPFLWQFKKPRYKLNKISLNNLNETFVDSYLYYVGSLTLAPFTENVQWVVANDFLNVTKKDYRSLVKYIKHY
jgi:carbonic anhydrase